MGVQLAAVGRLPPTEPLPRLAAATVPLAIDRLVRDRYSELETRRGDVRERCVRHRHGTQADPGAPAGRMVLSKTYHGDLHGTGIGQMISKRTEGGAAVYYAIEEFSGSVEGRSGAFTLVHQGRMTKDAQSLEVQILEGSGSGELTTIAGSMVISQGADGHVYELAYEL